MRSRRPRSCRCCSVRSSSSPLLYCCYTAATPSRHREDTVTQQPLLQELLSAQQQLAEAYRHEARQALERLSQLSGDGPIAQQMRLQRQQEESMQRLRDELEREQARRRRRADTLRVIGPSRRGHVANPSA